MQPTDQRSPENQEPPLGQRLFDSPILLLVAGIVVMFLFYTIWGMYEVMTLPEGTLP